MPNLSKFPLSAHALALLPTADVPTRCPLGCSVSWPQGALAPSLLCPGWRLLCVLHWSLFLSSHSSSSPCHPSLTPISSPHCTFGDHDSICVMFPSLINTVHTKPQLSGYWKVNAPLTFVFFVLSTTLWEARHLNPEVSIRNRSSLSDRVSLIHEM